MNDFPWIISRRRFIFATIVDAFLCIFIYSKLYQKLFNVYPNILIALSISFFWVIVSYVLGRYIICKEINFLEILKNLFKSIILFFSCNLIYFFINLSNKILILFFQHKNIIVEYQQDQNIFFVKSIFYITITSFILQFLISIITNEIYGKKKTWIFYGAKEAFNDFMKELDSIKNSFSIKRIDNKFNVKEINFKLIEGIIIDTKEDLNPYNKNDILFFKSKGIYLLSTLKWFENKLHRVPPKYIEHKEQILEKFNLQGNVYKFRVKRIGDFLVSLFLLFITLPISILIVFCISFEDKGPIFYSQVRTGFNGKKYRIYKFRSMIANAEKFGPQWSQQEDKRVTKVGRIIRALRFDELPQLISVIDGKMSLIGPRPERPEIEKRLLKEIPFYTYRNMLKPGISGWAQVNYPYGASKNDTIKKLSYDIYYINHISFFLDILILFKTIKTVFNAKGYKPQKRSNL